MKELQVYVWWSAGKGDGDGYEDTIEITDEQYDILKELDACGEELDEINDPRVADACQDWHDELIKALYENSVEYEDENYREDCLIDPDSDEYDPDGDEEQFTMSIEEWWDDMYRTGARIIDTFQNDDIDE